MVFVNLGTTAIIIVVLLATTPRGEMHSGNYVFGSAGVANSDWRMAYWIGVFNGVVERSVDCECFYSGDFFFICFADPFGVDDCEFRMKLL